MNGLYVLNCVVYRVYKRDILVMKNLQIWGTGWAASWAFFKVIEKTQGMTNIFFRISSFASSAAKWTQSTRPDSARIWTLRAQLDPKLG